jgi:8-oxo-dGTP pyrophosphatase MutT (NUDIX family)
MPIDDSGAPVARAVAVVIIDGHVLTIRRRRAGAVYAVLPGGHVEAPESRQDAVIRELAEETTLSAQVEKVLWIRTDGGRPASYFLMRDVTGSPVLAGEEATRDSAENSYQLVWASPGDFEAFNLQPLEIRRPLAGLMAGSDATTTTPGA